MTFDVQYTNRFLKDLKLAKKRGFKIEKLKSVVTALAEGKKLEKRCRDHALSGEYGAFRECHIEPDWLLIYRIDEGILELFLFRTGKHSDLF